MSTQETLSFAVCLFNDVQLLDYSGPMDLIGFLSKASLEDPSLPKIFKPPPKVAFEFEYLAPSKEPLRQTSGPAILPTMTYDEVLSSGKQFNVFLVPGGESLSALMMFCVMLSISARKVGARRRKIHQKNSSGSLRHSSQVLNTY